eukprot:3745914-Prymnesium_polylepis.1
MKRLPSPKGKASSMKGNPSWENPAEGFSDDTSATTHVTRCAGTTRLRPACAHAPAARGPG